MCNVPVTNAPGKTGTDCFTTNFGVYRPSGIGYKNVDINVAKSFHMPWASNQELTVYFQALNVFDFVNRNYSMWTAVSRMSVGPVLHSRTTRDRLRAKAATSRSARGLPFKAANVWGTETSPSS